MSVRTTAHQSQPPMRRCLVCRESASKAELLRIVRRPDGEIVISNRDHGRGAYLHGDSQCLPYPFTRSKQLAHALRRPLPDGLLDQLQQLAGAQPV